MPATNTLSDQFYQLRQQRGFMVGLLLLLVVVVFWVALGLFSSQQKFAVPKAMRDLAKPLSPIVNEKILSRLETKRSFSPAELTEFTIYKVILSESSKQLKLVDISFKEPSPEDLVKPETKLQGINSAATSSSNLVVTPTTQPATNSGAIVTPAPTAAPTLQPAP